MKITVKSVSLESVKSDVMALFLYKGDKKLTGQKKDLDKAVGGRILEVLNSNDFTYDLNSTLLIHCDDKSNTKRVLLIGLGDKKELTLEKAKQSIGTAVKAANKLKQKNLCIFMNEVDSEKLNLEKSNFETFGSTIGEAALLSLYKFTDFKTDKESKKGNSLNSIEVISTEKSMVSSIKKGVELGMLLAEGTNFARDLAMTPPNVATPTYLMQAGKSICKESKMKFTALDSQKMEKLGMDALLGVGKGSVEPPFLFTMEYNCGKKNADTIAFVGKGITFDTGGISLKPSKKMEEMKFDMCGSAAVLGMMKIVSRLKPDVNVTGVVVTAENQPGGNAQNPGDVVTAYNGTTIEIINTDAEGRLVLADGLAYTVDKIKPKAMINLATLTGAVVVALGHYATGMMGNNDELKAKVKSASESAGEMVWELPLYPEYDEHLKSTTADIKNSNGPGAGATYGGCFLQKFVGDTPWVHLDIAGTAWGVPEKSYLPKGPTGVGVRLLSKFALAWKK